MAFSLDPKTEYPRIRWAVFCLVFFAIPIFLVCFWFNQTWREREENRKIQIIHKYEEAIGKVARWDKPVEFFQALFRQLKKRLLVEPNPQAFLRLAVRNFKERFPGTLEFLALTPEGEIIPELTDGKPPKVVLKRFMQDFRNSSKSENDPLKVRWSLYRAFFGTLVKYTETMDSFDLHASSYTPKHSFILFSTLTKNGMFIVFFNQTPNWDILAFQDRIQKRSTREKQIPITLVDISKKDSEQTISPDFAGKNTQKIAAQFEVTPQNYLFDQGLLWVQKMVTPTHRLLSFVRIQPDPDILAKRRNLVIAVTAVFAILSFFAMKIMVGNYPFYLSIRLKLLLLFLYAVGLPLSIMAINARDYIQELRFRLENQMQVEVDAALNTFDKKYPQQLGYIQSTLERVFGKADTPGKIQLKHCETLISKYAQKFQAGEAQLINEDGNVVFSSKKRASETEKRMKMLKPIYVNLLKNINSGQINMEEIQDNPGARMAAAAGFDTDAIYADWAKSLGKIRELSYGEKKGIQAIFPVADADGKARFLALFAWSGFTIQYRYLLRYLHQMERRLTDTHVFARNEKPEKPGSHDDDRDVPEPKHFRYRSLIKGFLKNLMIQGQSQKGKVKVGETTYLLTGIKGTNLNCYHMVGVTSDRTIQGTISDIYWKLKCISLALVFISLTVGGLLARKFLEPVGQLASGVQALRNRDFQLRIPVMDQDELGDLSSTFNEMMESMEDLEVARIVQESLFVVEPLAISGCSVYGSCLPATQVGGDYFDYFPLADNRLGMIIGDVSGHGVPAAMVMAMAKATVVNMGANMPDPGTVLLLLHNLLLKTLKKKRMMTCFLGIIDPAAKRLVFSNAGQNNPFLSRRGEIIQIVGSGYPLGSRSKASYSNQEMALEWGDRIIFYTDGLIEANAVDGEVVGYRRMEETFTKMIKGTPKATENAMRDWHRQLVAPGPQADDITMVIIHFDQPPDPTGQKGEPT